MLRQRCGSPGQIEGLSFRRPVADSFFVLQAPIYEYMIRRVPYGIPDVNHAINTYRCPSKVKSRPGKVLRR